MSAGEAWYADNCPRFLETKTSVVVGKLSSVANEGGWHIEADQQAEWNASVTLLRDKISEQVEGGVELLKDALGSEELSDFTDVILEYNIRRRGLRIDCLLLAPGLIVVLEFKRSGIGASERDQVSNYAINLAEFHEQTQQLAKEGLLVVPMLALTHGKQKPKHTEEARYNAPWDSVLRRPLEADASTLRQTLRRALQLRTTRVAVDRESWINSRFSPSSTILDAAISLYGAHDVSAIEEHAEPAEQIAKCTEEVAKHVRAAQQCGRNRVIFVSGAPGAGKTLVGLNLAFRTEACRQAVFVTGNAPLVKVLSQALKKSYSKAGRGKAQVVASGYAMNQAAAVIKNAAFKIVAAHQFLGRRGANTGSRDGGVVIFDEAQRTYEKGKIVAGHTLKDHEANLILESLENSYDPGAVVVALLGHNQAINRQERGAVAWLEAVAARDWDFSIADETLELPELKALGNWGTHERRHHLEIGHLGHSMRFFRNKGIEEWAHAVLNEDIVESQKLAGMLKQAGHTVWITRDLNTAKAWIRKQRKGTEQAGMVASGQAKRLVAEGLFANYKPEIESWMLAGSGDCRSSNMLETVQNQYQIQGLELDYVILCWGADLRRSDGAWNALKLRGNNWIKDDLEIAKNGYRVLLTRARRGMVVFVPRGDASGEDETRRPEFYDRTAEFLKQCGGRELKVT